MDIFRKVFKPYSYDQIKEILVTRLSELKLSAFDAKATEFVARKASNVAGDLRTALKICQRTIVLLREHVLSSLPAHSPIDETDDMPKKKQKKNSRLETAQRLKNSTVETTMSIVMQKIKIAVEEFKESPFIATATRACLLDKAILLILCKNRYYH